MKHVIFANKAKHRLPFYLAAEEYVAHSLPDDDYFFIWQVEPTVICGRNQFIDLEVNLDYCAKNNINVYRRRSGGGCVYADMGNLMFSYITPTDEITSTFSRYTSTIAQMLQPLGLDARATGRNDILVAGQKVSGNAFYHIPGHSIVHGTMLYDTNLEFMTNAITPSRSKLASNHVQSVESRITMLKQHIDMDIEQFRQFAVDSLASSHYLLSQKDIEAICDIEQNYYSDDWIYRKCLGNDSTINVAEQNVGQLSLTLDLCSGQIKDIDLTGDFFLLSDLDNGLLRHLKGCAPTRQALTEALNGIDCSRIISGLSTERFIEILTDHITTPTQLCHE